MKNRKSFPPRTFFCTWYIMYVRTHVCMHATGIWKTDQANIESKVHLNVAMLICTIHMLANNYAQQSLHYLFKIPYNFPVLY